ARPARGAIPGLAMKGTELAEPGGGLSPLRRGRRLWASVVMLLVLIAAGALAVVGGLFDGGAGSSASGGNGSATSVATVQRRTLSQTTEFNGTLGYAGSYTVLGLARGTVTWLPTPGYVVSQGQVLYR